MISFFLLIDCAPFQLSFFQWADKAFDNMLIVPPGSGICHQVNLEYFSQVVFNDEKNFLLYPDTVVSEHTFSYSV